MLPKVKAVTDKNLRRWIWQVRDRICIFCSNPSQDPHHIIKTSRKRLDLSWNMFGVCRNCHSKTENGEINHFQEIKAVNNRLQELGMSERFRTDGKRIRLEIGPEEYKYL